MKQSTRRLVWDGLLLEVAVALVLIGVFEAGRTRPSLQRPVPLSPFSPGVPAPTFPGIWVPMQMKYGQDRDEVGFCREEYGVGEIANERAPGAFFDRRKLEWIV